MVTYILEHAKEDMRERLRRYLFECQPGFFIGNVSAGIRDRLWAEICNSYYISATMIYPAATEQGFAVKITGVPSRKITNLDGINCVTVRPTLTVDEFVAKSPIVINEKTFYKTLRTHLYETAEMCRMQCTKGLLVPFIECVSIITGAKKEDIINCFCFLCAVHDLGKLHPLFQLHVENDGIMLQNMFSSVFTDTSKNIRHEQYSHKLLRKWMRKKSIVMNDELSKCVRLHHQGHDPQTLKPYEKEDMIEEIAEHLCDEMYERYAFPVDIFDTDEHEYGCNGFFSLVTTVIILCDWAASGKYTYLPVNAPAEHTDMTKYIDILDMQILTFMKKNDMLYIPLQERFKAFKKPEDLLKTLGISSPTPLQKKICAMITANPTKAHFILIEASCGSGKTEAGEIAALFSSLRKAGFYFALPTSVSSDAMQARVQALCNGAANAFKIPSYNSNAWLSEAALSLDNMHWARPSRQKLFYPIAVGTIDQLLASVQNVKYGLLRLLALSGKVLILDELHAYDTYMNHNLEKLLSYCGWLGITVVALSATLPKKTKQAMIGAYANTRNYNQWDIKTDYPLVTDLTREIGTERCSLEQYSCNDAFEKSYNYEIYDLPDTDRKKYVTGKLVNAIRDGGCCAIVCNTVKDADELHTYIKEHKEHDIEVYLVRGLSTIAKRDEFTRELQKKFGKYSREENRPYKAIVISTQIIEQSLDVDFDYLFTYMCPIDLLIQRTGRCRRHHYYTSEQPAIGIFAKSSYKAEKIYNPSVLETTEKILREKKDKNIRTPQDIRILIDTVYDLSEEDLKKEIKAKLQAERREIEAPDIDTFQYAEAVIKAGRNMMKMPVTRLSEGESVNLAIVDPATFELLRSDASQISIDKAKHIMRNNTIMNFSLFRIDKYSFDKDDVIEAGRIKGFMAGTQIYKASEDGWVYGDEYRMTIENGFWKGEKL